MAVSAGAARGIRTPDPIITNDVLYQLSYCGCREILGVPEQLGQGTAIGNAARAIAHAAPIPCSFNAAPISSRIAGSSMVAGRVQGS
jgi:hypothetical protein